MVNI
ncbi:hypothetical protein ECTW09195_0860, partial [Escherichia coli TW09195]